MSVFDTAINSLFNSATSESNAIKSVSKSTVAQYYKGFNQIIGLPHRFNDTADPNARTFITKMFPAAPLVLFRPGNIKYTNADEINDAIDGLIPNVFKSDGEILSDLLFDASKDEGKYGVDNASIQKMQKDLASKTSGVDYSKFSKQPIRYFEFDPAVGEYLSYVSTISGHMYSRLTGGNKSWLPPQLGGTEYGGFFTFWADGATSVTESVTNDIGESMISSTIKGVASTVLEVNNILGTNANGEEGAIKSAMNHISQFVSDESAGTIRAGLGDALKGNIPNFPQIWKDNSFSREYSLSFKLYSPYGDPASIYKNVLLPFSMLLAYALPKQNTFTTFRSPFLFQLDCPGQFACDMGLVTSISFVKGGSDGLWGWSGLPRAIDVTMNVVDLYPTLMQSNNTSALYSNTGLITFLDNLAGINLVYSGKDADIFSQIKSSISIAANKIGNAPESLKANAEQFANSVGITAINNIFK